MLVSPIQVLASPFTCFDARQYAALLLVDPEEEYYKQGGQFLESTTGRCLFKSGSLHKYSNGGTRNASALGQPCSTTE